ncbi:MAG: hypothetical protein HKO66_07820 [Saprospiraceae bacterium]|nr:hypothetical protein [Bacteroidia bacterium]NNE14297.1 hypothetical protein [Saprospiraceae bacterium]NNL92123.1 hypothetical protein [Saprospiraceae bacterium]
MTQGFEALNDQEFGILKDAIAWITLIIANADGKIDERETEWAQKLTKIRSYNNPSFLNAFYEEVGKEFSDTLDGLMKNLPEDKNEATAMLSGKLEQVNAILPCLDNTVAYELYHSYKSFAKHVAKASGGFLGMMSISTEESLLMELPMIEPISIDEEE